MSIKLEQVRIPEELPIAHYAGELVDAIRDHQVVVVAGETGSGRVRSSQNFVYGRAAVWPASLAIPSLVG